MQGTFTANKARVIRLPDLTRTTPEVPVRSTVLVEVHRCLQPTDFFATDFRSSFADFSNFVFHSGPIMAIQLAMSCLFKSCYSLWAV